MNWKPTWVLLVCALALFGFILVEQHLRPAASKAPAPARLLAFQPDAITNIVIRRTNQFILQVERSNAASPWKLTAPLTYPAQSFAVERLLHSLENFVPHGHIPMRELSAQQRTIAEYGLDVPQGAITLHQQGRRLDLVFGAKTAVGDHVYLQLLNSSGIYIVGSDLVDQLPHSATQWRDTSLVNFAGLNWDRLEVRAPGRGFAIEWDSGTRRFVLSKPTPSRANSAKIEALFRLIQGARVQQFITDDRVVELEPLGLQPPELELAFAAGRNEVAVVQFGRSPSDDSSMVYARRLSHTNIVLVARSLLEALQASPNELRDRHLVSFSPDEVDEVEVIGTEKFTLRRQTNAWQSIEPEPLAADTELIRQWFADLGRLEGTVEKDVAIDFAPFGLHPATRQYTFKATATNSAGAITNRIVAQLEIGSRLDEKIFVRRADENTVYAISPADFSRLPGASWQFRDRRVWNFTTNQVQRLSIRQNGSTRQFVRNSSGDWKIAPGSQGIIDNINSFAVEETMYRLGELQAAVWIARGEEERARYGFDERGLKITLELKGADKPRIYTLEFGDTAPSRYPYALATWEGQSWIFEFPLALFFQTIRNLSLSVPQMQAQVPR